MTEEWKDLIDFQTWNKNNIDKLQEMYEILPEGSWRQVWLGLIISARRIIKDLGVNDPFVVVCYEQADYVLNTFGDRND